MEIGDRIRARRKDLEITQVQLADRVREALAHLPDPPRVHQSDVSCWERGTTPSTPVLVPIADVLGVSLRWLLTGEDDTRPAELLKATGTDGA